MSKYNCPLCFDKFTSKKKYIVHMQDEYEEKYYESDIAYGELERLGATEY